MSSSAPRVIVLATRRENDIAIVVAFAPMPTGFSGTWSKAANSALACSTMSPVAAGRAKIDPRWALS